MSGGKSRLKRTHRHGKCIFCGQLGLSKEHIWSQWMHPILGIRPGEEAVQIMQSQTRSISSITRNVRTRQGSTATTTVRAVCKTCNNGWMNRIEQETRPFLEPLILGQAADLLPTAREQVARWITMKLFVGEHNQTSLAVVPLSDRSAFMTANKIPDAVQIWIGQIDSIKWKYGWQRHGARLSWPGAPAPTPKQTVQTTTFGAGRLLVFALLSYLPDFQHRPTAEEADRLPRLWPLSNDAWPPARMVTEQQADHLASSFHHVLDRPNVKWRPAPEERE